jgi:hypothetical protein
MLRIVKSDILKRILTPNPLKCLKVWVSVCCVFSQNRPVLIHYVSRGLPPIAHGCACTLLPFLIDHMHVLFACNVLLSFTHVLLVLCHLCLKDWCKETPLFDGILPLAHLQLLKFSGYCIRYCIHHSIRQMTYV